MNHPIISSANGQARYNEMVQTADNYRRVKQMQQGDQPQPSYLARFSNLLGSMAGQDKSGQVTDPATQTS